MVRYQPGFGMAWRIDPLRRSTACGWWRRRCSHAHAERGADIAAGGCGGRVEGDMGMGGGGRAPRLRPLARVSSYAWNLS